MEIFLDLLPAIISVLGFLVLFFMKNRGVRIPKELSNALAALISSYVKTEEKKEAENPLKKEDNSLLLADFLELVKKYAKSFDTDH
ncbi:hypothetical protein [Dipodfec virus UOA04_Rod_765]|nr:hypothetical protein [Dipodfec virus UOA04_Rod_765]